jgi:hypothetical protein
VMAVRWLGVRGEVSLRGPGRGESREKISQVQGTVLLTRKVHASDSDLLVTVIYYSIFLINQLHLSR